MIESPAPSIQRAPLHWVEALVAAGTSPSYARLVAELQDAHNAGRIDVETGGEVWHGSTDLVTALAV